MLTEMTMAAAIEAGLYGPVLNSGLPASNAIIAVFRVCSRHGDSRSRLCVCQRLRILKPK